MRYYSIYDALIGFTDLVYAENDEVAKRRFSQVMNGREFYENKADYSLYYIGYFDKETGAFNTEANAEYICGGKDV